jgi:outer membrane protein TolC
MTKEYTEVRQAIMRPILLLWLAAVIFWSGSVQAQAISSITLEQCYKLAEDNYPLAKQRALIEKSKEYNIDNLSKAVYPQLSITGQATYQSDVTHVQINVPGVESTIIPKEQFWLRGEASQPLTDFGVIKHQKNLVETNAAIQQENISVELYRLKDRINQLYFGVLMIDEQIAQNDLLKRDIQTGMSKVDAAIKNGTDFRSSLDKLKAELLRAEQKDIELNASRKAYTDMLSLFINKEITSGTSFIKPATPIITDSIHRPEIRLYDLQQVAYLRQKELLKTRYTPKVNLFLQGGMGQPSPVNFLSRDVAGYYMTGLRLSWNLNGLYTLKKEKMLNENDQQLLMEQRNTFLFNTNLSLKQQNAEVDKLRQLMRSDNDIVQLRESVKKTSAVQLENGVITTNDYLREVNAEDQARQNLILHQVQLLMAQYNHKTTSGN